MARFPFQFVNISGIPTIESRSVVVGDSSVNFTFNPNLGPNPFRGLLLVYLSEAIPEGTTDTLPITFTMAEKTETVTVAGGSNLTVADFGGVGVYLVYYDRYANVLQLIS